MTRNYRPIFISAAFGLLLAACGGGSAEFKDVIKAQCEKMDKTTDCNCAAEALDKELDNKTKALVVAMSKGQANGTTKADVLKDAGVTEEEASKMMMTAMPALMKAAESCKKT